MLSLSRVTGLSDIQIKNIYLPVQKQVNSLAASLLSLEHSHKETLKRNLSGGIIYRADLSALSKGDLFSRVRCLVKEIFNFTFITPRNITIALPLKAIKTVKMVGTIAYHLFFVSTAFIGLTWNLPARVKEIHDWETHGSLLDIARLTQHEQEEISDQIRQDIDECIPDGSISQKHSAFLQILSYYARSAKVYGPIVKLWVEHLLNLSEHDDSTFIFLARDGTAPCEVARHLLKENQERAQLAYLSRKVISWSKQCDENKELAMEYLQGMLNIQEPKKKVRIVDIGFAGSMIDDIKSLIMKADSRLKADDITFHYLVSHTPKAEGFIGCLERPLEDIASAGQNPAVHWLEDSHQGILSSPKSLVRVGENIYPSTLIPGQNQYCVDDPLQRLLRSYSLRASVNYAIRYEIQDAAQRNKAIDLFKQTLADIRAGKLPLFITHI